MATLYLEGQPHFNRGLVEIPDDAVLIRELRQLERHPGDLGKEVETRIYGTETKAPKRPLMCNRHFVETKRPHELPPVRGYSQRAGKSLFAGDCVVDPAGLELRTKSL
jgi:hypothetical protein